MNDTCRLELLRTASGGTEGGVAVTAKAAKRTARALAFLVPLIALTKSPDKLVMRKGVADWATHRHLQARTVPNHALPAESHPSVLSRKT